MSALSYQGRIFVKDGQEHRILSGSLHYFRIHPQYWRDRLGRLKAMGANTVDVYIAWNFHQGQPGQDPSFAGWADVADFIELAAELELDVIVRPGPYICAEWDNGGLPAWFTAGAQGLRSMEPSYTGPIETWFDQLLPHLVPLQASQGGPIIAFQAENEYGSYGTDKEYLQWNIQALRQRGVTELIFTADGGSDYFLDATSDEVNVLSTATFGSGSAQVLELWHRRRQDEPMLAMEFWCGWFDHWGEPRHTRAAQEVGQEVATILDGGGSVNIYMAHGGTNFGLGNGANYEMEVGKPPIIEPTATSYDYDAPIAEDGTLTEKFYAIRKEFARYASHELPEISPELAAENPTLAQQQIMLESTGAGELLQWLKTFPATHSSLPSSFDQAGLANGLMLYSTRQLLSAGEYSLRIPELHDKAWVYVDGTLLGQFDEISAQSGLPITGTGEYADIDILVENEGRINYGYRLGEDKGILSPVLYGVRMFHGWDNRAIALDQIDISVHSGAVKSGTFELSEVHDAWMDSGHGIHGFLWINGFLVGRYRRGEPHRPLYIPAPLLRKGENTVVVLDLVTDVTSVRIVERPLG